MKTWYVICTFRMINQPCKQLFRLFFVTLQGREEKTTMMLLRTFGVYWSLHTSTNLNLIQRNSYIRKDIICILILFNIGYQPVFFRILALKEHSPIFHIQGYTIHWTREVFRKVQEYWLQFFKNISFKISMT